MQRLERQAARLEGESALGEIFQASLRPYALSLRLRRNFRMTSMPWTLIEADDPGPLQRWENEGGHVCTPRRGGELRK